MLNDWMKKNYPLQHLHVIVQGRKDCTLADLAAGLRMAADELERGVSFAEDFDDDWGYRFHVELSQDTICRLNASRFSGPRIEREPSESARRAANSIGGTS
jgi:hypothetical protein